MHSEQLCQLWTDPSRQSADVCKTLEVKSIALSNNYCKNNLFKTSADWGTCEICETANVGIIACRLRCEVFVCNKIQTRSLLVNTLCVFLALGLLNRRTVCRRRFGSIPPLSNWNRYFFKLFTFTRWIRIFDRLWRARWTSWYQPYEICSDTEHSFESRPTSSCTDNWILSNTCQRCKQNSTL